ncbi:hypothetical protein MLD38_004728 [Melastoma candidum]|uniref:Uncharacterized protein n=1 Tax=Melastoma candidum TaxID=119954 RepID=A0ACB9S709_9MYRT|nr:hypothetical protein MLD38_004728 [Melastoma candidum]
MSPSTTTPPPSSSPSSPGGDVDPFDPSSAAFNGNIQYLLNISSLGAASCLLIFLLLKLRSDHHVRSSSPNASAILSKLLATWHASSFPDIASHCGADPAQFLILEGATCALLISISALSVLVILPVNLYLGHATLVDEFSKSTISHIEKGSLLLWVHLVFVVVVVVLAHYGINEIESRLRATRSALVSSTSVFTVMIQGLPKTLDGVELREYFARKYPGKISRVVLPMDLCALDDLASELVNVRHEIAWLVARIDSRMLPENDYVDCGEGWRGMIVYTWRRVWKFCVGVQEMLGFTDEDKLRRLQEVRAELETELTMFKEGRAPGAGVGFVVFKDVYTANKAVKDFRSEKKRKIGRFFSVMELRLQRNQWKVERAPLATDIYWNHLGLTKLSMRCRRVAVNMFLLLMLLFFSSPLALISALKGAARIINAEALDNAQTWLKWVQSSSWFASLVFQFLPNVIIFVSMYIIIPAVLSYLSRFEKHLTVSGEKRAALIRMVCFFLVNLILLRGLVESSLESFILKMGRCYVDGEDCKKIEQYLSASFLSRSCLSSLAFLITSTFLGISYDLLAPIPWIKKNLQKFRRNDMLELVPEQSEDRQLEQQDGNGILHRPLLSDDVFGRPTLNGTDLPSQDLNEYPVNGASPVPKQKFDFAQYYAFNLTIFAITMIYSSFAPLVVPVGAIYYGYRYVVDKYNFLFVYRVRGFPAGNDGRLTDVVVFIMRLCVDLFLLSMLLYFAVQGDSMKLQAIFTLGMLVMYKVLPSGDGEFQPALLEGVQGIDSVMDGNGPIDYEIFSRPRFDWDTYYS